MEILQTTGSEFYTIDGKEFVGKYYIDDKNIAYIYNPKSKIKDRLIPHFMRNTELVRRRAKHKGGYLAPSSYAPAPTPQDYARGKIKRYFMQKRTSPRNTIIEVAAEDYEGYGSSNNYNRVNSNVYNATMLEWAISGNVDYVKQFNKNQVDKVLKDFPGLDWHLINLKEFFS